MIYDKWTVVECNATCKGVGSPWCAHGIFDTEEDAQQWLDVLSPSNKDEWTPVMLRVEESA